jgi:hypothetical protein
MAEKERLPNKDSGASQDTCLPKYHELKMKKMTNGGRELYRLREGP